jgi:hypothetical protein
MHLELQGLNLMRPWQVALGEYLEREFGDLVRAPGSRVVDLVAEEGRAYSGAGDEVAR